VFGLCFFVLWGFGFFLFLVSGLLLSVLFLEVMGFGFFFVVVFGFCCFVVFS
jgi:hypothetical protein